MTIRQGLVAHTNVEAVPAIEFAADRGFDFVELDMESAGARRRVDPTDVREAAAEHDVDLVVHLPYRLDLATPHEHVREGACRQIEAAIDLAVEFGADRGVYHADTFARPEVWDDELLRERLRTSVERITQYADERNFLACVENLKEPWFDVGDFPDLFERTDAVACLDTGHAHVSGYDCAAQAELLREYPERFAHVHLNDTRIDENDEHLPVGLGKLDFEPIAAALEDRERPITCTHEVFSFGTEYCAIGRDRFDEIRRRTGGTREHNP